MEIAFVAVVDYGNFHFYRSVRSVVGMNAIPNSIESQTIICLSTEGKLIDPIGSILSQHDGKIAWQLKQIV